jgi:hypothetical protein
MTPSTYKDLKSLEVEVCGFLQALSFILQKESGIDCIIVFLCHNFLVTGNVSSDYRGSFHI